MQHFVQHKCMNATTSCTVKHPETWPHKVVYGSVKVMVHKRTTPSGHENFMVVYKHSDGKRKFPCFKVMSDALGHADKIAREKAGLMAMGQSITSAQAIDYFACGQRVEPFGVTLDASTNTVANCLKIVPDLQAVEAAVRFYKAHHKTVAAKLVADVVAELLEVKKSHSASERYLEDLK